MPLKILYYGLKLLASFVLFFLYSPSKSCSQTGTWQPKKTLEGASTRYLAVGFSIGAKGYMGTGYGNSNFLKDFWEYDPATDTWSQKADFGGGPRVAAVGFSIGNKGYVGTGATNTGSDEDTKDFWEYDPETNVWTRKADFSGAARQVAVGFNIGNKGYIGTGRTTGFNTLFQDFWEYDPANDTWLRKADFGGGARYATSGFSIGTMGYIGTGTDFTGGGFTFRSDFWEYNQATNTWTRKADFGGGTRELAVGFSINNKGYIGTGLYAGDFWEYNPSIDTWARKADFGGGGRNMAAGFAVGGRGYICTGAGSVINDLWTYIPPPEPPSTLWAKAAGGAATSIPGKVAISADQDGNTYVTGPFTGTFNFPSEPTPLQLTSEGESDIFIAKYDASGNVLWAKRAGGAKPDFGNAIKYDGLGNVYVVGGFTESANFGNITLTNNSNSVSVYIAKYSAATGDLLWVQQGASSSPYYKAALDVAVDNAGNAYITGQYEGTITFAPLPAMTAFGWWDIFIVKFNGSGVPQWETTAGSPEAGYNSESGNGIAVDPAGNVFVTGILNGSSTYPTLFGAIQLTSPGGGGFYEGSYFLAKYNPSTSTWEWAVSGGGSKIDYGNKVSVDGNGNVYVNGYFEETASFGTSTITSYGPKSFFIAKYSQDGNLTWVKPTGGVGYNAGNSSKVDAKGNLYFVGTFDGSTTVGDATISSNGFDNTYIASWNGDGEFQWVKHIPGSYYASVYALDVESNGNLDILGGFAGTETFDCTVLSSSSYSNLAIAKLGVSADVSGAPTLQATANSICSGNSTTLSISSGNLNNATYWKWYTGSCGGTLVGSGNSITVSPEQITTYYARAEGGCAGPGVCGSITITIDNTQPVVSSVSAPVAPIAVNTLINLDVVYTDNDVTSASIKWGDASGIQTVDYPVNSFTVPHTYNVPGVYSVEVILTDACGVTSTPYQYQYVVVYDPNGGFVTGGGWINSPVGAYRSDVTLSGKAIFGFESKYQKGATVPNGNTEFKFQVAGMNFKSTNYEWLVVSGSRAQFKGTGTINGSGNYGFLLSAIDGDLGIPASSDLFRIKIWDKNAGDAIVYDNQYGAADQADLTTQLAGGSIVIHTPNKNTKSTAIIAPNTNESLQLDLEDKLTIEVLPNPSKGQFVLRTYSRLQQMLTIRVLDNLGRLVEVRNSVSANATFYLGDRYLPGVYYVEVAQGSERRMVKLIKQ